MTIAIKDVLLPLLLVMCSTFNVQAQDSTNSKYQYQARAPQTQPFGKKAFGPSNTTTIRWLGMSGFFINSHGTTLMIDPLLGGFDMPVMIEYPISAEEVPHLDAVLITHSDNDHYSIPTLRDLAAVTDEFHSTIYVDSLMTNKGWPSHGHNIGDEFNVGPLHISLTPVEHAWQNAYPEASDRIFKQEDACGFWIETPDGSIWVTGDSRLMEQHLNMPTPDAILLFYSADRTWHFGLEGSIKIANAYPHTPIILAHWGTVDAPNFAPFNADPSVLYDKVVNPERIVVLAPGEPYKLTPIKQK